MGRKGNPDENGGKAMMEPNPHERRSHCSELTSPDRSSRTQSAQCNTRRHATRKWSRREFDMVAHIFGFRDANEMAVFAAQLAEKKIRHPSDIHRQPQV
ncbi:hypothetical protein [Mycolicibacterium sp. XJ879]